jgi:hypothetical protein
VKVVTAPKNVAYFTSAFGQPGMQLLKKSIIGGGPSETPAIVS